MVVPSAGTRDEGRNDNNKSKNTKIVYINGMIALVVKMVIAMVIVRVRVQNSSERGPAFLDLTQTMGCGSCCEAGPNDVVTCQHGFKSVFS